jgi:acetoin utilization deacetylase AcuC-like enzyme
VKPRVVHSSRYAVDYGGHAFVARKFALAAAALGPAVELVEPPEPSRADLLLAHDEGWADRASAGTLTEAEIARLELPYSPEIAAAHRLAVGGTILAARHALESGVGLHCGGGAHHAFRGHGEGYCALNDLAVAALKALREWGVERVAVVDLDAHQGNGTASILAGEPRAFTFSMHQADLYPERKEKSALDLELAAGTGDAEYYDRLRRALREVMDFRPGLVLYQAGVDPWEKDRLAGLRLTERGLLDRDQAVREACLIHGVPVAVTLGGGYGPTPEETACLHAATLRLFAGIR